MPGSPVSLGESESIAPMQVRVTSVSLLMRERRLRLWKPMHLAGI